MAIKPSDSQQWLIVLTMELPVFLVQIIVCYLFWCGSFFKIFFCMNPFLPCGDENTMDVHVRRLIGG